MITPAAFEELRPYLFSIAYRMLGSATEAEDVVQDAWLRAQAAPDDVRSPKAWLSTVATRLCLDRLKSARASREHYVGPWLFGRERLETVLVFSVEGERISAVHSVRNPEKLAWMARRLGAPAPSL